MTASAIAHALGGRQSGNRWIARCPAHDDHSPSLAIAERDGVVLVHCYAGCSHATVIASLRERGLWPERIPLSRADRERWAREHAETERIRREAEYFADAAALMAEEALEELSPFDPERAVHTRLLMALRVSTEAEYRAWLEHTPTWAAALVYAGRERERRLQMALAEWIAAGMPEVAHE